MRARRDDAHAAFSGEGAEATAELGHFGTRLLDVGADAGAGLDYRLMHLGPHPLAQDAAHRCFVDDLRDVRVKLPRLVMDDLELFLDAERELAVQETHDVGLAHASPSVSVRPTKERI